MNENKYNRGDDYYNRYPDKYSWADEVGWIDNDTGEVVEAHEGFETRHSREEREADEENWREERRRERGW